MKFANDCGEGSTMRQLVTQDIHCNLLEVLSL
jgi:hypothetical protein